MSSAVSHYILSNDIFSKLKSYLRRWKQC